VAERRASAGRWRAGAQPRWAAPSDGRRGGREPAARARRKRSGGVRERVAQASGRHAGARALAWLGRQLERCGSGSARLTASGAEPRRWVDAAPERSEDGSWRRAGERLALVACGARRGSALAQAVGDAGGAGACWASGHWAQGAGVGAAGAEQSGLCR
jgi:hypothetical protein